MLLKVVFDETAFVKFSSRNNFKQNIDKTHFKQSKNTIGKSIQTYGFYKSQEKNP